MISVRLRGHSFKTTPEDVKKVAKRLPPSRGRKYVTIVNGTTYSPKELLDNLVNEKKLPLTRLDFTTMDAVRILRRLGFDTVPIDKDKDRTRTLFSFAGILSLGGDSLKESEAWYE